MKDINITQSQTQQILLDQEVKVLVGFEIISYKLDLYKIADALTILINQHNSKYPNSMVEMDINQILSLINSGQAIIILDNQNDLIGFIKLYHWGSNTKLENVIEIGTWIVSPHYGGKGYGMKLLFESVKLAKLKYSNPKVYAIVARTENTSSKIIFEDRFNLTPKPGRPAPIYKLVNSEADHYDITNII